MFLRSILHSDGNIEHRICFQTYDFRLMIFLSRANSAVTLRLTLKTTANEGDILVKK